HLRLVWRVVVPSARPLGDFEVLVEARSGAVVRIRNLTKDATTPALVFDPNPLVEQGSRAGLADDNGSDNGVPLSLYRSVTLQDLDGCLKGLWVDAVLRSPTCPSDLSSVTRSCG